MTDERRRFDRSPGRRHTPADQATVRRSNLGLVLRHLRDAGPRSRARIAQETGLNKATVSSLVAELTDRRLVSAGDVDRAGSVGRPGLIVHLDGRSVCGIGVELNVDYAAALVLDLRGEVLFEHRIALDVPALGPERTLDAVAGLVAEAEAAASAHRAVPVGVTVAVPGLVRSVDGVATYAPNIGWHDVPVLEGLRARIDLALPDPRGERRQPVRDRGVGDGRRGAHRRPRLPDRRGRRRRRRDRGRPAAARRRRTLRRGRAHLPRRPRPGLRLRSPRLLGDRRRPGRTAARGRRPRRPGARPGPRPGDPARRDRPARRRRRRAHPGRAAPRSARRSAPAPPSSSTSSTRRWSSSAATSPSSAGS